MLFSTLMRGRSSDLRIDRLNLDVGDIPLAQFEARLKQRLLDQLGKRIRASLSEQADVVQPSRTPDSWARRSHSDCTNVTRQSGWLTGHVARQRALGETNASGSAQGSDRSEETPTAVFERYLRHGYLPRSHPWRQRRQPDRWLMAQWRRQPLQWLPMLAASCLRSTPLQRMVQTCRPWTLRALCRLLLAGEAATPPIAPGGSGHDWTRRLSQNALLYFARHPELVTPAPDEWVATHIGARTGADSVWQGWLMRLVAAPRPPAAPLRLWLRALCLQPGLRERVPRPLFTKLEQLSGYPFDGTDMHTESYRSESVRTQTTNGEHLEQPSGHTRREHEKHLGEGPSGSPGMQSTINDIQTGNSRSEIGRGGGVVGAAHTPVSRDPMSEGSQVPQQRPGRPPRRIALQHSRATHPAGIVAGDAERLEVSNAGVVLLWPLLPGLLSQLGVVERGRFVDPSARIHAVCWLDALVWRDGATAEWRTPLTKLLCGYPLEEPLFPWAVPDDAVAAQLEAWLSAIPAQLPGLARCTAGDLRRLFLQRPGDLVWKQAHWTLRVQPDASDILLADVPWPLNHFALPWLDDPMKIDWMK
jgi:hypothetical protein